VDDQLVSLIDLAPTMLNLAGVPLPQQFQGRAFLGANLTARRTYVFGARDRMDERYDIIRAVRDNRYRYIRNYEPDKPYYQHMDTPEGGATMKELRRLHTDKKLPAAAELFMAERKPEEELYDLHEDPHEIRNLASSPRHKAALDRMRQAHQKWVEDTKDLGLIPEPELVEGEKIYGSRYAILRAPENNGLAKRLLDAVAGKAPRNDPHPAVRYWAVRRSGQPLPDDPAPAVRIASARLTGNAAELTRALRHEVESVRLMAAIALGELGGNARPAVPQLKAIADEKGRGYPSRVARRVLDLLP
jgi:uncharacterized sulfatase